MEQLVSFDKYKELLNSVKTTTTNMYLGVDDIKRYLSLERLYYEMNSTGLFVFTDEENYYRMYVYLNSNDKFDIHPYDKPIMTRNIYKENNKPKRLQMIEQGLKQNGFQLYDESVQIYINPMENENRIRDCYEKSISFLGRTGIKIIYAKEQHLNEIIALRNDTTELKPYHFFYETREEMLQNIQKGYYRCAITQDGIVCGVQQFSVEGKAVQGNWLAVKEKYKVKYGIGMAMAYSSFVYAIDHNIPNYYGWVVRDNIKSMKYHQAIGYKITQNVSDEWLLE